MLFTRGGTNTHGGEYEYEYEYEVTNTNMYSRPQIHKWKGFSAYIFYLFKSKNRFNNCLFAGVFLIARKYDARNVEMCNQGTRRVPV